MSKVIVTLLLVLAIGLAGGGPAAPSSAPVIFFFDDFSDNRNHWPVADGDSPHMELQHGQYTLWDNTTARIALQPTGLNGTDHYKISVSFVKYRRETENDYGFVFGVTPSGDYHYLGFNPQKGRYCLGKRVNGQWSDIIPWTDSNQIRNYSDNQLSVQLANGTMELFINGSRVNHASYRVESMGNRFGLYIKPGSRTIIDEISVFPFASVILLQERFDDNRNGWQLSNIDTAVFQIQNGVLSLRATAHTWVSFVNVPVTDWANLQLEGTFQDNGSTGGFYGVVFAAANSNNYHALIVGRDRKYCLVQSVNGAWRYIVPWTWAEAATIGTNKLGVIHRNGQLELSINGVLVNTADPGKLENSRVGVLISAGARASFDDLVVRTVSENTPDAARPVPSGTLFLDGFDDNRNGWPVANTAEAIFQIRNGAYSLCSPGRGRTIAIGINLADWSDVMVESVLRDEGSPDGGHYGLALGGSDANNCHAFLITRAQTYCFGKFTNNAWEPIVSWTRSEALTAGPNRLGALYRDGKVELSINGTRVNTVASGPLRGNWVGVYVSAGAKVAADHLTVRQEPPASGARPTPVPASAVPPPTAPARPAPAAVLLDCTGTLQRGDSVTADYKWYDRYPVWVTRGETYAVMAEAGEFNVALDVELPGGRKLINEDYPSFGSNALIVFTAWQDGWAYICPRQQGSGSTGKYHVIMKRVRDLEDALERMTPILFWDDPANYVDFSSLA